MLSKSHASSSTVFFLGPSGFLVVETVELPRSIRGGEAVAFLNCPEALAFAVFGASSLGSRLLASTDGDFECFSKNFRKFQQIYHKQNLVWFSETFSAGLLLAPVYCKKRPHLIRK